MFEPQTLLGVLEACSSSWSAVHRSVEIVTRLKTSDVQLKHQGNAERLAVRREMRDSHALRQLRGKRLVCSAGVGENPTC